MLRHRFRRSSPQMSCDAPPETKTRHALFTVLQLSGSGVALPFPATFCRSTATVLRSHGPIMNLETLISHTTVNGEPDCAAILSSLISTIIADPDHAQALGWLGSYTCPSRNPAWICRIDSSEHIFGIRFDGQVKDEEAGHPACLRGLFGLYVFPPAQSPILDRFPLEALRFAISPYYDRAVYEFSGMERELMTFLLGQLRLDVFLDKNALALTLDAPARHKMIAVDGVPADNDWLVRPGEAECDVPAFRLFLPLFSVLASTLQYKTGEKAAVSRGSVTMPRRCFHADGTVEDSRDQQEIILNITASFGASLATDGEQLTPMNSIPSMPRMPMPQQEQAPEQR